MENSVFDPSEQCSFGEEGGENRESDCGVAGSDELETETSHKKVQEDKEDVLETDQKDQHTATGGKQNEEDL